MAERVIKRVSVTKLMNERRCADLNELRHLFTVYVDDGISSKTLMMMNTNEVRRLIALSMYEHHVLKGEQNRTTAMKIIGQITGYSRQHLYDLFR